MKVKDYILGIIVILIVILCGIGGGYLVYKSNIKTNDTTNNNNDSNIKNIDYSEKVDIASIDINKKLDGYVHSPEPLTKLEESNGKINITGQDEPETELDYVIHVIYNNKTFSYVNDNGEKKEYNNVNSVYYISSECSAGKDFYLLFDDKVIVIKYYFGGGFADENIKIINTNKGYDAIYSIFVSYTTCEHIWEFVGYVDSTSKYYKLYTGKEIDTTKEYVIYDYITPDRKLKIDNKNLIVKLIITNSEISGVMEYIIDANNYLYGYVNKGDEDESFEKLSDKKVKFVYYTDIKYTYIQFEDGTFYDFNGEEFLSYSQIKY